jgi:hypothetical protein
MSVGSAVMAFIAIVMRTITTTACMGVTMSLDAAMIPVAIAAHLGPSAVTSSIVSRTRPTRDASDVRLSALEV